MRQTLTGLLQEPVYGGASSNSAHGLLILPSVATLGALGGAPEAIAALFDFAPPPTMALSRHGFGSQDSYPIAIRQSYQQG